MSMKSKCSMFGLILVLVCQLVSPLFSSSSGKRPFPSVWIDPSKEYAPLIDCSRNGKLVYFSTPRMQVGWLNANTGRIIRERQIFEPEARGILLPEKVYFLAKKNWLVFPTMKKITIWNIKTEKLALQLPISDYFVARTTLTDDGSKLAEIVGSSGIAQIFDIKKKKLKFTIPKENGTAVGFSHSNRYLALTREKGIVELWDSLKEELVFTSRIRNVESPMNVVAFSMDDRMLAIGSDCGSIAIFNTKTGEAIQLLKFQSGIYSIAFSLNGRYMAAGGHDGQLFLLRPLDSFKRQWTVRAHHKPINTPTFSPTRPHLLTGSWDRTIKCWTLKTGQNIWTTKIKYMPK